MEKKINRTLVIGAHYDDTAWCWAGLVSQLTKRGQVDEAVLTDTDYAGIGLIRKQEQLKMMGILGMGVLYAVGENQGFKDGYLNKAPINHVARAIINILSRAKNEGRPYGRIISFGPDGYTGHPDHITLAKAVEKIFESKKNYGVRELWQVGMSPSEQELWPKNYFVEIPKISLGGYARIDIGKSFNKKIEAIMAHQTQFEIPGGGGRAHIQRLNQLPKVEWYKIYRRK
jgi:LmbE family N-acetylglucosaminyl deacetylase